MIFNGRELALLSLFCTGSETVMAGSVNGRARQPYDLNYGPAELISTYGTYNWMIFYARVNETALYNSFSYLGPITSKNSGQFAKKKKIIIILLVRNDFAVWIV